MRLLACGILFLSALLGQQPGKITVDTHLVEVDVVVVTDDGNPVTNLTQADFTVLDRGKRQNIAGFSIKTPDSLHAVPTVPDPPGTVSNRAAGSGVTVILFDTLNMADSGARSSAPQSFGRQELLKYVHSLKAANNESFAFLTLDKSVRVAHDFTTDPKQIVAAAERLSPEHSFDQSAQGEGDEILADPPPLRNPVPRNMFINPVKEMQDNARVNRANLTVAALRTIAHRLRAMPGRKKLIWISAGFPVSHLDQRIRNGMALISTQDFGDLVAQAVHDLNDANIAVYPIDPRDPVEAGLGADGIDSMKLLSGGTGGRAFYSVTDLADAIRQSVNDTQVTYTLSFYPSDLKADGSFHPISVQVARRGLEVRARRGYFAPTPGAISSKQIELALKDIITSPLNSAGLSLKARAAAPKPGAFDLEITFDPRELHLERQNNDWVALLDLVSFAPRAEKPNAYEEPLKLTLTDARLREVLTAGRYTLRRSVHLNAPPPADLRVVLADRVTGAAGSVTLHVTADSLPARK